MRPHPGGDGAIVRLRLPGGWLPLPTLQALLQLADGYGAPFLQLTSRANLQVRGLPDPLPDAFVAEISRLGLLPSTTHELARNVLTAPFSSTAASTARQLDRELCGRPALAGLPGRFLFAVEGETPTAIGGSGADIVIRPGAVAVRRPDLTYVGREVEPGAEITSALALAEQFLASRPHIGVWRTHQLPPESMVFAGLAPWTPPVVRPPQPGVHGQHALAGIPLGLLGAGELTALSNLADRLGSDRVELTPWKAVAVPIGRPEAAPPAVTAARDEGLVTDDAPAVTACLGAPWCGRTNVQTLPLARALLDRASAPDTPLHLSGCERRCGTPAHAHVGLVPRSDATADDLMDAWKTTTTHE
nr:hypothetical protein [Flexivirga meconopsidis]